jgi:hypothetical protein
MVDRAAEMVACAKASDIRRVAEVVQGHMQLEEQRAQKALGSHHRIEPA